LCVSLAHLAHRSFSLVGRGVVSGGFFGEGFGFVFFFVVADEAVEVGTDVAEGVGIGDVVVEDVEKAVAEFRAGGLEVMGGSGLFEGGDAGKDDGEGAGDLGEGGFGDAFGGEGADEQIGFLLEVLQKRAGIGHLLGVDGCATVFSMNLQWPA